MLAYILICLSRAAYTLIIASTPDGDQVVYVCDTIHILFGKDEIKVMKAMGKISSFYTPIGDLAINMEKCLEMGRATV